MYGNTYFFYGFLVLYYLIFFSIFPKTLLNIFFYRCILYNKRHTFPYLYTNTKHNSIMFLHNTILPLKMSTYIKRCNIISLSLSKSSSLKFVAFSCTQLLHTGCCIRFPKRYIFRKFSLLSPCHISTIFDVLNHFWQFFI